MRRLLLVLAILFGSSCLLLQAKNIGSDPPPKICSTCSCNGLCPTPPSTANSAAGSSTSITEGNLSESASVTAGEVLPFTATYNSYNADGSRAQVDTTMG